VSIDLGPPVVVKEPMAESLGVQRVELLVEEVTAPSVVDAHDASVDGARFAHHDRDGTMELRRKACRLTLERRPHARHWGSCTPE
jgi:hypothetical protein